MTSSQMYWDGPPKVDPCNPDRGRVPVHADREPSQAACVLQETR